MKKCYNAAYLGDIMRSEKYRLMEQVESEKSGLPIPTDDDLREFEKTWDRTSPVPYRLKLYATRRYIEGMDELLARMGENFLFNSSMIIRNNPNFQHAYGRLPLYCHIDRSIIEVTRCDFWRELDCDISAPEFLPIGRTSNSKYDDYISRESLEYDQSDCTKDEILAEIP